MRYRWRLIAWNVLKFLIETLVKSFILLFNHISGKLDAVCARFLDFPGVILECNAFFTHIPLYDADLLIKLSVLYVKFELCQDVAHIDFQSTQLQIFVKLPHHLLKLDYLFAELLDQFLVFRNWRHHFVVKAFIVFV